MLVSKGAAGNAVQPAREWIGLKLSALGFKWLCDFAV